MTNPQSKTTGSGWNVLTLCVSAVCVALIASFTVVVVTANDPNVFLTFLAGPFLGNLGTFIVLIISAVLNRKVNAVSDKVRQVERNTNGTTTALVNQNQQLTQQLLENGGS